MPDTTPHLCPSCGTQTTYQTFSGGREWYCPGRRDNGPYEDGQAPRRVAMLRTPEGVVALRQEMNDHLRTTPDNPVTSANPADNPPVPSCAGCAGCGGPDCAQRPEPAGPTPRDRLAAGLGVPHGADFVTVERVLPDGTTYPWTDLTRLADGRVMCALCHAYTPRDRLAPDPEGTGCVIDVCLPCALREQQERADRAETALARVRELHVRTEGRRPLDMSLDPIPSCTSCGEHWPCPTITALTPPADQPDGDGQ